MGTEIKVPGSWWRVAAAMVAVGWGSNQFVPLLLVYRRTLDLSEPSLTAIFAVYALGLAPGFLLGGPAADRYGRRPMVLAFTALSAVASAVLITGRWAPAGLYVGRLLIGGASGVVFAVGSAWLKELSPSGVGARRSAISLSAGFGAGALAGGVLAQWAPAPDVLPYLVHILLVMVAVTLGLGAVETRPGGGRPSWTAALRVPREARSRYLGVVLPIAPWVFACATIAFTVLPGRASALAGGPSMLVAGLLTALTLATGAAVQPLAGRLEASPGGAARAGLAIAVVGLALAALAAQTHAPALVVAGVVVLGAAYGNLIVAGLREIERLARPETLAGMVALFYAVAYLGIFTPYLLSRLAPAIGYAGGLGMAGALAAGVLVLVTVRRRARSVPPARRRLPPPAGSSAEPARDPVDSQADQ